MGHYFARAIHDPCVIVAIHPTPGSVEVYEADSSSSVANQKCYGAGFFALFLEIVLQFIFITLPKCAETLCFPFWDKDHNCDLGVDLDNLWTASQDLLSSTDTPVPSCAQRSDNMTH